MKDKTDGAGELVIRKVDQYPASNYVVGLHFLTGVAAAKGFGIALTLGRLSAATPADVTVSHEILAHATNNTDRRLAGFADIDTATAAVTANDVADAIDMLTVAATAI